MIVSEGKYYLYRHIRLDRNEVFYIGVGQKIKHYKVYENEYRRAFEVKYNRTPHWKNINKLCGRTVEILMESDDYDFIVNKEKEFIKLYGRRDLGTGSLVNLNDGGGGMKGYKYSNEQKKQMSERRRKAVKDGKYNFYTKKIYQYSMDGKFIKEYNSLKEAEDFTKIGASTISKAAKNNREGIAKGYKWLTYYGGEVISAKEVRHFREKKIQQFNRDMKFLCEYNSAVEAANILGLKNMAAYSIRKCAIGNIPTAYNYIWKYKPSNNNDESSK